MSFNKIVQAILNRLRKVSFFKRYLFTKSDRRKTVRLVSIILGLIIGVFVTVKYLIAATVNGRPISRFAVLKQLESQGGAQVLDELITKSLILQEANRQNISISESDIDAEVDKLRELFESQGQTLEQVLTLQGQELKSLTEDIRFRLLIERMLENDLNVTEEEIKNYFEENKDFFAEDAVFNEVRDQVSEQLKEQKLSESFQEFITELRSNASIKKFVDY